MEVECPACSEATPTVLFCGHDAAACVTCCQRDHDTTCPTCRGTTNVREWVYPTGFKKPEPCPDCRGTGRKPKDAA